eukprot:m.229839 g.229839  ORF g.229839 m.229839 type:complete len:70 (+) comp40050_c0_seq29:429-638(+)
MHMHCTLHCITYIVTSIASLEILLVHFASGVACVPQSSPTVLRDEIRRNSHGSCRSTLLNLFLLLQFLQ